MGVRASEPSSLGAAPAPEDIIKIKINFLGTSLEMPETTFNTCTVQVKIVYILFFLFCKKIFFRIITPKFKLETESSQSDGSGCSQIPRPRKPDGCGWVEVATWAMRKGTEPGVWRRAALAAGHSATQTHSSCSSPNLVSSHTKKIT